MELKTIDIVELYKLIIAAKLPKLSDGGQIKLIRLCNTLKSIVVPLQEFEKDARERLKDENFNDMLRKAQQLSKDADEQTKEQRDEVNEYFGNYTKAVNECLKPELDAVRSIKIEHLSETAFEQFISANDFSMADAAKLSILLPE